MQALWWERAIACHGGALIQTLSRALAARSPPPGDPAARKAAAKAMYAAVRCAGRFGEYIEHRNASVRGVRYAAAAVAAERRKAIPIAESYSTLVP